MERPASRREVAYHEAGHAIAAIACGDAPGRITIQNAGEGLAGAFFRNPDRNETTSAEAIRQRDLEDCAWLARLAKVPSLPYQPTPEAWQRDMIIAAGGLAAQRRLLGSEYDWRLGELDHTRMLGIARAFSLSDGGANALMRWAMHEADEILAQRWQQIEALAAALIERSELVGDEILRAIQKDDVR